VLVMMGRVKGGKTAGRICEKSDVSREPNLVEARMAEVQTKNRITKNPKRSRFEGARMFGSRARECAQLSSALLRGFTDGEVRE
jgi:hypothetical protein